MELLCESNWLAMYRNRLPTWQAGSGSVRYFGTSATLGDLTGCCTKGRRRIVHYCLDDTSVGRPRCGVASLFVILLPYFALVLTPGGDLTSGARVQGESFGGLDLKYIFALLLTSTNRQVSQYPARPLSADTSSEGRLTARKKEGLSRIVK